jgi:thiamine phosphate synthase YjbQ (UPF0047 family)
MQTFSVRTNAFNEYADITREVTRIVAESGVERRPGREA